MEYVYAALLLHEAEAEVNEDNLTDVLDAAGLDVEESRVKALVAALEDVDIGDAVEQAAAVPAAGGASPSGGAAAGGAAEDETESADEAEAEEAAEEAAAEEEAAGDEEDEEVSGEGLGDLFG